MKQVIEALSGDRLTPYLKACGHDWERAIRLYEWNLEVSASFYPLLSTIEVSLRNCLIRCLKQSYQSNWWDDPIFRTVLGQRGKRLLDSAIRDITQSGKQVNEGRVTAALSFGFWVNMFLPKHEKAIWSHFVTTCRGQSTTQNRDQLYQQLVLIRDLRNRIFHHETLIGIDLTKEYSNCFQVLNWICPETALWIKPKIKTMQLVRQRP